MKEREFEGKLPARRGEVNGVGNVVVGTVFETPDMSCKRVNLIPFCTQNDSSARAWCTILPESGLDKASTSSTFRLQPNEGVFSSSTTQEKRI